MLVDIFMSNCDSWSSGSHPKAIKIGISQRRTLNVARWKDRRSMDLDDIT